jgi:serine/threonine-protein kinase HipA
VIRLNVWMRLPDGATRLAGEVVATDSDSSGQFESEFEYSSEWLGFSKGFDLDPASLSRAQSRRFQAASFLPPLGVFEDALPDSWGRRLMAIAIKAEGKKPSPPELLRRVGANGLGALSFSESPDPPVASVTGDKGDLDELLDSAEAFEAGRLPAGNRFRQLLEAGGTAGGARPKALLHDKGVEWIAKFPSIARDEHHDVVGLEATCMELARRAGLNVPETRLQPIGRRRILLVRRFDVSEQGGRFHMLSFKSLCRERPGTFVTGYDDLAQALRKYSADPVAGLRALFRQTAFNAAIGNVDDHLKNFWMVHGHEGWHLSPAFDLVPDTGAKLEHTLSFGLVFTCPGREALLDLGKRWGVQEPARIVTEVTDAVEGFSSVAKKLRVKGAPSVKQIKADIDRRLALLRHSGKSVRPQSARSR